MNAPVSTGEVNAMASAVSPVVMGFDSKDGFEQLQRAAKLLSSSTLVPKDYQALIPVKGKFGSIERWEENPSGLPNCVIALNMSQRINADVLMVMQNLHVIEGRPSWSSQFVIAALNSCGRFSPLRFELSDLGEAEEVSYDTKQYNKDGGASTVTKTISIRNQSCVAWVIEKATGEILRGPAVSIKMAVDEGWLTKKGSKWQTIPELMLRYRSATFFGRLYAPELLMGLQTSEEVYDVVELGADGSVSSVTRQAGSPSMKDVGGISMPTAKTDLGAESSQATDVSSSVPVVDGSITPSVESVASVAVPVDTSSPKTEKKVEEKETTETGSPEKASSRKATESEKKLLKNRLEQVSFSVETAMQVCEIQGAFEDLTKSDLDALMKLASDEAEDLFNK